MPPKTSSIWENTSFLVDLAVVLHEAALHGGALTPAVKGSMEESLRKQGYDTSWNAIRQHIQKLRKNRDVSGIEKAGGGTPKSTPSKAGGGIKRKTPSKRTANESSPVVDDDDDFKNFKTQFGFDEEELEVKTPTKKRIKKEKTLLADPDQDEEI